MSKHPLEIAATETAALADCVMDAYIGLTAAFHRSPELAADCELRAVMGEYRRALSSLLWTAERLAEWHAAARPQAREPIGTT